VADTAPSPDDPIVVTRGQLEDLRDEVDRTLVMIDELCRQRPHLIMLKSWCEERVGVREGVPTMRPVPANPSEER
jgi:hypothetical protein